MLQQVLQAYGNISSSATGNSTASFISSAQNWAATFASDAQSVLLSLDNAAIDVGKAAFIFLIVAGSLLYFTRASRRLGRELVSGGIVVGILIAFVFPFIQSLKLG